MVTRNFKNLLAMALEFVGSSGTDFGSLMVTDVMGYTSYLTGKMGFPGGVTTAPTLTANAAGISIGRGSTPASDTDYNLEDTITSGVSLSLTSTTPGVDEDGRPYLLYTITVTNTGTAPIEIYEVGYKQIVQTNKFPAGTSATSNVVLIDRTVLTTPLSINDGDAGIIEYKLVTQPGAQRTVGGVQIVSWEWGTDEQVGAMIDAAQQGLLDLQTDGGWQVGMKRFITVSAFTGGNNVAQPEQQMAIAISSFSDYNSCGAVLQFDFATCLSGYQRMNPTNTTAGGYGSTEMYTTTLPALVNALPEWLRTRLRTFSVLASKGGSELDTIETVTGNKLALRSEIEIFGTTTFSKPGEGALVPYYTPTSARIKPNSPTSSGGQSWWARSANTNYNFCYVNTSGAVSSTGAGNAICMAPFGCL